MWTLQANALAYINTIIHCMFHNVMLCKLSSRWYFVHFQHLLSSFPSSLKTMSVWVNTFSLSCIHPLVQWIWSIKPCVRHYWNMEHIYGVVYFFSKQKSCFLPLSLCIVFDLFMLYILVFTVMLKFMSYVAAWLFLMVVAALKPGSLVSAAKRHCTEISIRGSRPWYCGSWYS